MNVAIVRKTLQNIRITLVKSLRVRWKPDDDIKLALQQNTLAKCFCQTALAMWFIGKKYCVFAWNFETDYCHVAMQWLWLETLICGSYDKFSPLYSVEFYRSTYMGSLPPVRVEELAFNADC